MGQISSGFFDPDYGRRRRRQPKGRESDLNFLEAVFSFLFGDGDPNADLEDRRWQSIATVIRANHGVVTAEQIAPFLGDLGQGWSNELEDYMIPVLSRFNGVPEVSPEGGIVYQFPELQVMAEARQSGTAPNYLSEFPRRFSQASSGQIFGSYWSWRSQPDWCPGPGQSPHRPGTGGPNWRAGCLCQLHLLATAGVRGVAFLVIPLVRYFWVQRQNSKIEARNQRRQERAEVLTQPSPELQEKLAFADSLATQTVLTPRRCRLHHRERSGRTGIRKSRQDRRRVAAAIARPLNPFLLNRFYVATDITASKGSGMAQ